MNQLKLNQTTKQERFKVKPIHYLIASIFKTLF